MQSINVNISLLRQLKDIFPQHSDLLIATILQDCNNDSNSSITRLLDIPDANDGDPKSLTAKLSQLLGTSVNESPLPQFQSIPTETQKYSMGFEYSVVFHRNDDQGLDINVKSIGHRILVNELYNNKVTGLPGLSAQAGILRGDVFVGINYEYFNKECTLPDITRITKTAGTTIALQFFRFYDNTWLMDALAAARQGESITDINNMNETRRIVEASLPDVDNNEDLLYHQYNCQMNNYRDLYSFREQLLFHNETPKIHHCAFLLREQDLLQESEIDIFTETIGRLLSRCLLWDSGSICERAKVLIE